MTEQRQLDLVEIFIVLRDGTRLCRHGATTHLLDTVRLTAKNGQDYIALIERVSQDGRTATYHEYGRRRRPLEA